MTTPDRREGFAGLSYEQQGFGGQPNNTITSYSEPRDYGALQAANQQAAALKRKADMADEVISAFDKWRKDNWATHVDFTGELYDILKRYRGG